jgi:hypothetical protein
VENGFPDTLDLWTEGYFQFGVTTALSSQKVQKRDLGLFLKFMQREEGTLLRGRWTLRLSKVFYGLALGISSRGRRTAGG